VSDQGNSVTRGEPTDHQVMKLVGSGDVDAFRHIVQRYEKAAWRFAWRYVRDDEAARDLVQEAFLRIFRSAGSYVPDKPFSSWFYRVLVNVCLDAGRKQRLGVSVELEDEPVDPGSEAQEWERRRAHALLARAVGELPERYRVAVLLRHYEGMSLEEVAAVLQSSPKAVERVLAKARERLSSMVRGEG